MRPVPGKRPITNFGGPRPRPGQQPISPRRPGLGGPRFPIGTRPDGRPMVMHPAASRQMKKGGEIKTKSFPDLTGDGKVTMKDILKGRGVIKKKGGMMKKADGGLIRMHKQMAMSTKKFT
jgi:hypothetical protein